MKKYLYTMIDIKLWGVILLLLSSKILSEIFIKSIFTGCIQGVWNNYLIFNTNNKIKTVQPAYSTKHPFSPEFITVQSNTYTQKTLYFFLFIFFKRDNGYAYFSKGANKKSKKELVYKIIKLLYDVPKTFIIKRSLQWPTVNSYNNLWRITKKLYKDATLLYKWKSLHKT